MTDARTILVVGAAGLQGSSVAGHLLRRGHAVVGVDRDTTGRGARGAIAAGARMVQASFDDRAAIEAAAAGADAAFVMASPYGTGPEAEVASAVAVLESLARAGISHIVYSSIAQANTGTGIPHFESKARIERRLERLGVPYTIVAPTYFMENAISSWMIPSLRDGILPVALPPERPLHRTAVDDIATFVTMVVESPARFLGRRFDIASDVVTGAAEAHILSAATGRRIEYIEISPEHLRAAGDDDNATMFEWFASAGYDVDVRSLRLQYPAVGWHRLSEWAAGIAWDVVLGDNREDRSMPA